MGQADDPSNELKLLAACAAATYGGASNARVHDLAESITDWPRFVLLADRHQIPAHAHVSLRAAGVSLPLAMAEALARRTARLRRRALKVIAEAAQVIATLRRADIPAMVLKGPALAKMAFDDPTIRRATDLDVIVDPAAMPAARAALIARGYVQTNPAAPDLADPALLARYLVYRKDITLERSGGIGVELHCRLTNNPHLLDPAGLWQGRCEVEAAPGVSLPAASGDALIRYLCVHGAINLWDSVKWLADVAALLHGRSAAELADFVAAARECGLDRPVGQALLLLDWLEMATLAPELRRALLRDRATAMLFRLAQTALAGPRATEANALRYALPLATTLLWRTGWRSRGAGVWLLLVDADRVIARGGTRFASLLTLADRPILALRRLLRR